MVNKLLIVILLIIVLLWLVIISINIGVYLMNRDSDSVSDINKTTKTIECVWVYQPALKMNICLPYTVPKK